ncbi:MAG: YbhB/YbcL family Raf kinase inhibitor-like protein [Cyclobacteriaceae bacterium]|nr:YbhB/YbcL family Raf kinase inhibitor-like protein [Cyclobacteriaceae bacterium]
MKAVNELPHFHALRLSSEAFPNLGEIPRKYTCEGINISPPLHVEGFPSGTKSLVLVVEDPDAPAGTWIHWLMWNIPPVHDLHEGDASGVQGLNDFGVTVYGGPCPPSGSHHYHFKVYALDTVLELPEGSTRQELEWAMDKHIVAYGELIGRYKRTRHHSFA